MKCALRYLCFFCIFCSAATLWAQDETVRISFKIVDSFTRASLDSVTVEMYEADSVTLLSAKIKPYITNIISDRRLEMYYAGRIPKRAVYVVKFTRDGYDDQVMRITYPKKKFGMQTKDWTYPNDIVMRKNYNAFDTDLGEATVTASRILMVVKGDTVEYDARAFRLSDGSMLDNLMKMLPGVVLDDKGRIYLNGQYVNKLMVNGRDFFNGNPKIALDNLPAYTVDKVQFYHERQDWEYLSDTDTLRTEERPLAVNVKLKREYSKTWIANFELAGGSKLGDKWDNVYLARAFGTRITDHSAVAIYASANNLADDTTPGGEGSWRRHYSTTGDKKIQKGGVNFNVDGKKTDISYDASIEATHIDSKVETTTNSLTNVGSLQQKAHSADISNTKSTEIKWSNTIKIPTKSVFFSFWPLVEYTRNKGLQSYTSDQQSSKGLTEESGTVWESDYSRMQSVHSKADVWRTKMVFNAQIKSPFSGKMYSINSIFYYRNAQSKNETNDLINYTDKRTIQNRRDKTPTESYMYSINVRRTLFSKIILKCWWRMKMSYSYEQEYSSHGRTRETDSLRNNEEALTPSMRADWKTDWENTYHSNEMSRKHSLYTSLESSYANINTNSSFSIVYNNRNIRDVRNRIGSSAKDKAVSLNYSTRLSYSPWGVSLTYAFEKELPGMQYLLDVREAGDPLFVSTGNPDLHSPRTHNLSLNKTIRNTKHLRMFYFNIGYVKTTNAIGRFRSYDADTKVTTYTPRNINGNWHGIISSRYEQALDKKKLFTLNASTNFSLYHSVDYSYASSTANSERSIVDNYSVSQSVSLTYRSVKGIYIGAEGTVQYTNHHARTLSAFSNSSTEYSYGLNFTWPITQSFTLESDIKAYARRGYSDASMNTTEWIWNASATYSFGKSKAWLIRAVGFDILQQLSSTKRVVNEQGYTETRYNTIPSYATFHLIYRLNVKPKKK